MVVWRLMGELAARSESLSRIMVPMLVLSEEPFDRPSPLRRRLRVVQALDHGPQVPAWRIGSMTRKRIQTFSENVIETVIR